MTTVLVVDPNPSSRINLEKNLMESNQFGRVLACEQLHQAGQIIDQLNVQVVLVDSTLTQNRAAFEQLKTSYPSVGLVLLTDNQSTLNTQVLTALGIHAQIYRMATSVQIMATVAKALVARFR